jgi:hypothetical protein
VFSAACGEVIVGANVRKKPMTATLSRPAKDSIVIANLQSNNRSQFQRNHKRWDAPFGASLRAPSRANYRRRSVADGVGATSGYFRLRPPPAEAPL